jgi:hypothetical protein
MMLDDDVAVIWHEMKGRKILREPYSSAPTFKSMSETARENFRMAVVEAINRINVQSAVEEARAEVIQ